ncbi:MAG: OmpA family protein [Candidatus Omnitrophota bacterium]|nr:MAG: OmpA family protein [Candidatus Omnitrophota bacterium]
MKYFLKTSVKVLFIFCLVISLGGCTVVLQKRHTSDVERIESLSDQVKRLKMTEEELLKLREAYNALEKSLKREIEDKKVSLGIEERGLVITFVDSVLFNSGKAELRAEANRTLDKVANVCRRVVANREIGIEGHTDNQPIRYSGWESNWELSTARATSVLHYLVKKGISPERISATGFGKYRPVATNETVEGRQKNRRVEIVILPKRISRMRQGAQGRYKK